MKKMLILLLALVMLSSIQAVWAEDAKPIYKLTWATPPGTAPIDLKKVEEELNRMSRESVGVEVNFIYMNEAQLQNSMLSGEVIDMYFSSAWYNNYNQAVSAGYFADITDKVKEWTPKLYATMDEKFWELAKSADGRLYGIPVKKDFAQMNYITYDAKFAREHGFNIPDKISSWDEMTDFLVAQKAEMGNSEYPVMIGGALRGILGSFDLIDRSILIGVEFGDTKVKTAMEDPKVLDNIRTLHKWMQMGLVNPDAATQSESSIDQHHHHIKIGQDWPGHDDSPKYGYETAKTLYSGPILNTDGIQGAMIAFSATLEEDQERFKAAMKYQEMVNTDVKYRDALQHGIEGYHWNYVDAKQPDGTPGRLVLKTELGRTNYHVWGFSQGSLAIATIEANEDMLNGVYALPDQKQWEKYFDIIRDAPVSAIAGFTFDTDGLVNTLSELQVIKAEYYDRIATGSADPDTAIPEMLEKMNAAGLQTVIDEAQKQLDEYLASKSAAKAEAAAA